VRLHGIVINDLGIVGIVDNTSPKFATVVSILNVSRRLMLKLKNQSLWFLSLERQKSTGLQLIDVPRLASVEKEIQLTGGQSVIFPENINIGTINKIYIDNKTNYYTLDIKLFNDINLGHVYIIKSKIAKNLTT
jgi:rod shape-determining protein MreC